MQLPNLLKDGLVKAGQKIFHDSQRGDRYEAEILDSGKIKVLSDGSQYDVLSTAASHITNTSINGWIWWKTLDANGREILMDELRKRYVAKA